MSLPIWDDSIDSEENYIRSKIPLDTWISQSGASIFNTLKDAGFSIGENSFYAIRRDVLNIVLHQDQINSLRDETPIPLSYMDSVPTWNLSGDYMYQIKYTYTAEGVDGEQTGYYTYVSDDRLSKEELQSKLFDDLDDIIASESDVIISTSGAELQHVYTKRGK